MKWTYYKQNVSLMKYSSNHILYSVLGTFRNRGFCYPTIKITNILSQLCKLDIADIRNDN